jgi:hypothetical protein
MLKFQLYIIILRNPTMLMQSTNCQYLLYSHKYYRGKSSVACPNPDPDPRVFGLLDPDLDPLVKGMDPDPSIIKQK